jgi:hypothetical protein
MRKPAESGLRGLQKWMSAVITDPRGADRAMQEAAPATISIAKPARMNVYAEAYFSRLVETLGEDFRALRACLGRDSFMKCVAEYLKVFPPTRFNISEAGRDLPGFLRTQAPWREAVWPGELAGLEWEILRSFYADEAKPIDPSSLETLSPEAWSRARLELHPAASLLQATYPVDQIWRERSLGWQPDQASLFFLLVRREASGQVRVERLERATFEILCRMRDGATLLEICEGGDSEMLTRQFSRCVGWGLVTRVSAFAVHQSGE